MSKVQIRTGTSGGETLRAVTSIDFAEDIMDPLTSMTVTFEPLPADVLDYDRYVQRGEVLRLYFDGHLQCTFLVTSVRRTISATGGYKVEATCHHPIKVLYEAQLNSTYEKRLRDKRYTLGQLVVEVVRNFFFGLEGEYNSEIGSDVVSVSDVPVFEPSDSKDADTKVGLRPPKNDPRATRWQAVNVQEARAQSNETAYSFLARQCTRYGLILRPAANGAVMLTRPLESGDPDWVLGTDARKDLTGRFIDSFSENASNEGIPSDVNVRGQTIVKNKKATRVARASVAFDAEEAGIPERSRYRPGSWYFFKPAYVVDKNATDEKRCQNVARFVFGMRCKDAYKITCKLAGLADAAGRTYAINRLATLWVPQFNIMGDNFLVLRRRVSITSTGGATTELELIPKGALIIGEDPAS